MPKQPAQGFTTVEKMASYLMLTPRRLQQLAAEGVLPERNADGHYNVLGCFQGYIRYLQQAARSQSKPLTEAKEKQLAVRTEREQLKLLKEKRQLITDEDYRRLVGGMAMAVISRLRSIPSRIGARYPDAEPLASQLIHEAQSELAATDILTPSKPEPKPKTNRKKKKKK